MHTRIDTRQFSWPHLTYTAHSGALLGRRSAASRLADRSYQPLVAFRRVIIISGSQLHQLPHLLLLLGEGGGRIEGIA